jgi:hypothetical protein
MATPRRHSNCSTPCIVSKWAVAILLFLTSIAALIGVYNTHIVSGGVQFGSSGGSFAIIAFTVSVMAWGKKMACCMSGNCEVCDA